MQMPTLRQLEYLVAIADNQHFGRAAQAVHVSQPTLSQQLRTLEDRLGVVLVERGAPNAELTPIGRELVARARRILVEVRELRALARRAGDHLAGTLRFGVSPTLGPYLMPSIVAALHKQQPDLRLYIREGIPDDQAMELARGALDMLLGPMPIEGPSLHVEPLFSERLFLVAATDHPLSASPKVTRADIAGEAVLSLDRRHNFHRQVQAICADLGLELLRDYEGTSLDSLRQMTGSGLGLSILPEFYIQSEVGGQAGVKVLEIEDWSASRAIAASWREGAAYAPAYQAIAEHIQSEARALLG
jgi:LysR family hydrogen peroxide-inducible transcriptional activator